MSDAAVCESTTKAGSRTPWGTGRHRVVDALLSLLQRGAFQPMVREVAETAAVSPAVINVSFGSPKGLRLYVARNHARALVDSLGLSPHARAALSPRDEKALAIAVLAGRKLEPGD